MPKAARRESGPHSAPRAEPYPTIKPGDKPAPSKASSKALAERSSSDINASSQNNASTDRPASFLDVKLDDEDEYGNVPVYDTCSEIRRKINLLLGKDNDLPENGIPGEFKKDGKPKPYTKKEFARYCGASSTTLHRFLQKKKLMGGAESPVYMPAYKFFEKKRIFEGKKKTQGRLNVELDCPEGLELRDPVNIRLWLGPGENRKDFLNKYGQ